MTYDVAVIGAGITGALIARELSMLDLSVCVIEAESDVAAGATRANSGIVHAGYDATPGTQKAVFNVRGNAMMPDIVKELDVLYRNCGSLVVAFGEKDEQSLESLRERAHINGVNVQILSASQVRRRESHLSPKVTAALYAPSAGIVCPFGLAIAALENAVENGATVLRGSRVTQIDRRGELFDITAGHSRVRSCFIINAAGVCADAVSRLAGGEDFQIQARKGEYVIFDKSIPQRTTSVVFGAPTSMGKGVLFAPTAHGNMIAGPTAQDTNKDDKTTSREGISAVLASVRRYSPGIDPRNVIAVFSGLRAVPDTHDFIIGASKKVPGLIHVAGIESPGLTAAPAIAVHVRDMLIGMGANSTQRARSTRIRKRIESFSDASLKRRTELIKQDARYANVVCRCEHVTEAEIVQSIKRPCGAQTVDGVKLRTGAGFGRCHGGFCLPRVMAILARETGQSCEQITKSGEGSWIVSRMEEEK